MYQNIKEGGLGLNMVHTGGETASLKGSAVGRSGESSRCESCLHTRIIFH